MKAPPFVLPSTLFIAVATAKDNLLLPHEHGLPFVPGSVERRAVPSWQTPYAVIRPYAREWNGTFRIFFNHLTTPSPLHVWLRCDAAAPGSVTVHFMLEDMQRRPPDVQWRPPRIPGHVLAPHLHLQVDGVTVPYASVNRSDVDLYRSTPVDALKSGLPLDASIRVQFIQLKQFVTFPRTTCIPATTATSTSTSTSTTTSSSSSSSSSSTGTGRASVFDLPYVRPVDDGLLTGTIQPFSDEYSLAMRPWERVVDLNGRWDVSELTAASVSRHPPLPSPRLLLAYPCLAFPCLPYPITWLPFPTPRFSYSYVINTFPRPAAVSLLLPVRGRRAAHPLGVRGPGAGGRVQPLSSPHPHPF